MSAFRLGAIADDITGACDLAGGVAELGLSTLVSLGIPDTDTDDIIDCVVIALKSRSIDPVDAVDESCAAAGYLADNGATVLYQKYCSTFDSTDRGNIGPVADALTERWSAALSVGTPATPLVGRTQYQGHLFVGDRLLSESSLRDHPITPMRDSDLVRVLSRQTPNRVALIAHERVRRGPDAVRAEISSLASAGAAHLLVDAITDADLDTIAESIAGYGRPVVVTGAAGLGTALARRAPTRAAAGADSPSIPAGGRLILAGSSSQTTNRQVAAFTGPRIELDPFRLEADAGALLDEVAAALHSAGGEPVLVSATAQPERVREVQERLGTDRSAKLIEGAIAAVAAHAVSHCGVSHIIVAGGETSGAVATALGVRVLRVGKLAASGVPWTSTTTLQRAVGLLFKSGNFGGTDLFNTAWEHRP